MNKMEKWQHKWFGVWIENGTAYGMCPSITEFIDKKAADYQDKTQIAEYLETAQVVATTSRLRFPCVLTGKKFMGSLSYRTDGEWLWPDDLAYYLREHHVRLPEKMLEVIRRNNYQPPDVDKDKIKDLEWPPTTP